MIKIPNPGDVIPLETGDATILEVKGAYGEPTVLAARQHPFHPFATWKFDTVNGALYAGKYFEKLAEAEVDFDQR